MEDGSHIRIAISALMQEGSQILEVGYGVEIFGTLLGSEASIKIASDGDVLGIARNLADVIDVVHCIFQ